MALNWVSHPPTAPSVASVSPNPMIGSASAQTPTIAPANFAAGAAVQASYAGGPILNLAVASVSAGKIIASIVTGPATHMWNIVVTNPNGQSSFAASLQVNAAVPSPTIASLNPTPMTGSATGQVLIINGSGF